MLEDVAEVDYVEPLRAVDYVFEGQHRASAIPLRDLAGTGIELDADRVEAASLRFGEESAVTAPEIEQPGARTSTSEPLRPIARSRLVVICFMIIAVPVHPRDVVVAWQRLNDLGAAATTPLIGEHAAFPTIALG